MLFTTTPIAATAINHLAGDRRRVIEALHGLPVMPPVARSSTRALMRAARIDVRRSPISTAFVWADGGQIGGRPRHEQPQNVTQVVSGVREQRDRLRPEARGEFHGDNVRLSATPAAKARL